MLRGRLGTRRVERHLVQDVNLKAIPTLQGDYRVLGLDVLSYTGDAPKSIIVFPTDRHLGRAYIAKAPRKAGPRECVTEYLISCIGRDLPLRVAEGSLAILASQDATAPDIRFLSRYFLRTHLGEELQHGIELVADCFDLDQEEIRRQVPRSGEGDFYTVDLIEEVLRKTGRNEQERKNLIEGMARMLAYDSLLGANDRHPKNWGVVRSALRADLPLRFSPVFDTARGLFWNRSDEQLGAFGQGKERAEFLRKYAEDSRPQIGIPVRSRANHFDLVEYLLYAPSGRRFAASARSVLDAFDPDGCARMLHEEFGRVFSRQRLEFIDGLMRLRHGIIKKLLQPSR
jgi:HipA-like C-terminal domain